MIPVQRINHAVLYVRDAQAAAAFYRDAFGFETVAEVGRGAVFLRAPAQMGKLGWKWPCRAHLWKR